MATNHNAHHDHAALGKIYQNIKVSKIPDSEVEIEGEIKSQTLEHFRSHAIKHFAEELEVPGFRRGKVPEKIVVEKIGELALLEEAGEQALQSCYAELLNEFEIDPLGVPKVSITKLAIRNPMSFKIITAVYPEFTLPDYKEIAKSIAAKSDSAEVLGHEIEEAINSIRRMHAENEQKEKGQKIKDSPSVASAKEGEHLPPLTEELVKTFGLPAPRLGTFIVYAILCDDNSIYIGQTQDLQKRWSQHCDGSGADHTKKYKPQKIIHYEIFKSIEDAVQREKDLKTGFGRKWLKTEFAAGRTRQAGKFENLDDFKTKLKESLVKEKELRAKEKTRLAILKAIIEKSDIPLPRTLIDGELNRMVAKMKDDIERMGMKMPDYLKQIGKNEDKLRLEWEEDAKERARIELILNKISEEEKIEAPEEEIEKEVKHLMEHYKDADPIRAASYFEHVIRNEKVFQFLEGQK